eukprot:m.19820 g.19820  ORF g.19820 m.19820 type:complete len:250 (-) comp10962_c0_seq2:227-976(-)
MTIAAGPRLVTGLTLTLQPRAAVQRSLYSTSLRVFKSHCNKTVSRPFRLPSLRIFKDSMSTQSSPPVVNIYSQYLTTHPLTTKVLTAGVIGVVADLTAQLAIERSRQLDVPRLTKFVALQMAIIAPVLHVWYGFLNRRLPGNHVRVVLQRVALDQLAFAPPFLAFFLATLSLLEGHADRITQQLSDDWFPTVVKNWQLWVPAQLLNFRFVGPAYQVLFSNMVGLFWTIYLSVVAHHTPSSDNHKADDAE